MTIEAVNQFLTKVSQDQQLQVELSQAMGTKNEYAAAVELAAQYGYKFTTEEFATQIEQLQNSQTGASPEKLSEEELEAVAGGFCTPLGVVASVVGGASSLFRAVTDE